MKLRRTGIIAVALSLLVILAACGGSKSNATTSAADSNGDNGSASITPGSTASPVDLATAYQNLVNQDSFVMTAKLSHLGGSLANFPGVTDPTTVVIERAGNDRHVQIITNTNRTLFEIWRVNGQLYINIGLGASKTSENDSIVKAFLPLLDADSQIINGLSAGDTTYTVIGSEKVDGVQSNAEDATYNLNQIAGSIFSIGANSSVDAKIWVAQSGSYLVKAGLTLNESTVGSAVAGTASAGNGANVVIDITKIGTLKSIKAPL